MGCNVDFYCTCYFLRVIRMELGFLLMKFCGRSKKYSDTGNRTPSCRVKGGNVSRYTISDICFNVSVLMLFFDPNCLS